MAYFELLDRDAVLGNLERARDLIHRYLAGEAEGPPSTLLEEAGEDGLTPDELGALAGEMSESLA